MKQIVLILTLFASYLCTSQSGSVRLSWAQDQEFAYGDSKINIPHFDPEFMSYDLGTKSLKFQYTVKVTSAVNPQSLQITNTVYESIGTAQLGLLSQSSIPSSINTRLQSRQAREDIYASIELNPIIKDNGSFKRLVSFDYSFTSSSSRVLSTSSINAVSNSVLTTGDWYRFYVEKSGVYKISRGFLQSLGMNTSVDPRKIKIYGSGGRMIPLRNSQPYPLDIAENAIVFEGESDGNFDGDDYILLYAEGMDNWSTDSQTHNNLYADRAYYYVTSGGDNGKRITTMSQPLPANASTSQFTDHQYHERDLENIGRLGRRWFGEKFNIENEQEFEFQFPGIVSSEPVSLQVYTAASAPSATNFTISVNGQQAGTMSMAALGDHILATPATLSTTVTASEDLTVTVTYNNNGVPGSIGYLDYIILEAKRSLKGYTKQYRFENNTSNSTGNIQYNFTDAGGIGQVWDVTDIYNVTRVLNTGSASFSFTSQMGDNRRFAVIDPTDYYAPHREGNARVANQNIKGTILKNQQGGFEDVDYLIVAPESLITQAERLAAFHRSYSNLSVRVISLEKIYTEFASGKQDIGAIRNLVKYIYFNASDPSKRIKYLNLFGDASFDFKDRIPNNTNIVPIFHALNGYTEGEGSFSSDDFFCMLDENEGELSGAGGIDVAPGRMIVSTASQASEMVDKVIDYYDLKSYGPWRNNYVLIADDSDAADDAQLQTNQEALAQALNTNKPFLNVEKIYLDSYEQESAAGGERYPKARLDIFNDFEKGSLVFNYLGHGGEDGLSAERIWTKEDGQNLSNRYKYPLFITITCEFSRFDNPYRPTAGEYIYLNPKGGAISMVTTTRTIGQGTGQLFNARFSQYLLSYVNNAPSDEYYSIAECLRRAKNSVAYTTNVVVYLGDPALMLAVAKPKVRLTKINDMPVTGPVDTLESLGTVKLSGEITDQFNTPLTSYAGEVAISVFDKELQRTTLNNDNNNSIMPFKTLGETLFRGNASVTAGQFDVTFVVPRDIRIPVGNGRVSFYAKRNELLLDKSGYDTTIKVGGINENAPEDNIGPTVKLYMNDQTFVSGGVTNESPFFLAFLEDENGINTASGIGHDITAILDGDESNPYVLNDYYEADLDNHRSGKLRFPFRNLEKGLHTITFQAWDVYNNPITAEIQFIVVGDEGLTLTHVLNYPNPFSTYTQFWFSHNKPYEPLEVQVQVMTVTGKVVWTKNQVVNTEGFLSREVTWDGKDDFGDRIGKGVYIYKLTVRSTLTNVRAEKIEKLVIL
ncbi:type IX secretion system sortase PorU [Flavobacterium silvaticum]|uniref:Type IX secretion system sortase PorU n=1 Tax=Flavobacterium silvaticum TaxID=1852020 RepID=A0A972JH29_9FLAO|nr:type IX secretion system sortase PorU [Flavobacterium silvaticum]NMH29669.1 type IX secretion system sortase PorU [Flavobacterium silvaticum]